MRFLNRRRILSNMRLATLHLSGNTQSDVWNKSTFIDVLNRAQSTTIKSVDNDFLIEFENPELVQRLTERTVFSSDEVWQNDHLFPHEQQLHVEALIKSAKKLLEKRTPNLFDLITMLIGSVAVYRIPKRDGGSVSCCIGLIWLSPRLDWSVEYCGEMLVHEFVHNSVFLEDMVRGIMPSPDLLEDRDALGISAIRQTRRPFDKVFHSACVTAALMYYYHSIGKDDEAQKRLVSLKRTVRDLHESERALHSRGLELVTKNGREMIDELNQFTETLDYLSITNFLAPTMTLTCAAY